MGARSACGVVVAAVVLSAWCSSVAVAAEPLAVGSTLENLQAAFNGESNAHARYVAFAEKADAEGYGQVASLFRAAARAEAIHAANHAEVIKKLGGTPEAKLERPAVKSTKENLQAALAGESYERDTMYPQFLQVARKDANREAVRTMNLALLAEIEHARLYQQALSDLESWKAGRKQFYVCSICGNTSTELPASKCPACFNSKEKFEIVQ